MIPRISEVDTPVVGRFYVVSVVYHRTWKEEVAIYGPAHDDKEFLDFEDVHWHVDWRFSSSRFVQRKLRYNVSDPERFLHGIVASVHLCSPPKFSKKKMLRETPPYPIASEVPWLKKLEDHYAFNRLPKCLTCPHRGISLKHAKPDEHGIITCPGHGLSWNRNTGFLVRST